MDNVPAAAWFRDVSGGSPAAPGSGTAWAGHRPEITHDLPSDGPPGTNRTQGALAWRMQSLMLDGQSSARIRGRSIQSHPE